MSHPFDTLGLKIGEEVWVRAKIAHLAAPGTLGYREGWVTVRLVSDGLLGEQPATVRVSNIGRETPSTVGKQEPSNG